MTEFRDPPRLMLQTRGSWIQRTLLALMGASLAIVAFFFITIALITAAFIALAIGVRCWWWLRRVRAEAAASGPLEGEYTVIENAASIEKEPRR